MAQKPKPEEAASAADASVVFARFGRQQRPSAALPLPPTRAALATVPAQPAIDLAGKPKATFFIGRGRVGKTTCLRWWAETMDDKGGTAIVAAADPINRSLRLFRDNVAEPESTDAAEVRDWLRDLLQHLMDTKTSALIDLGGGSTSLGAILEDMPDLADVLSNAGVAPVAIHVVGADPHDLVPLAMTEAAGFTPAATAIVCNERDATRSRFGAVLQHPAFQAAVQRGAVPLWMPRLSADAVEQVDDNRWRYHDVRGKAGPFVASAVQTWLRRMTENFAPVASWIPDA